MKTSLTSTLRQQDVAGLQQTELHTYPHTSICLFVCISLVNHLARNDSIYIALATLVN